MAKRMILFFVFAVLAFGNYFFYIQSMGEELLVDMYRGTGMERSSQIAYLQREIVKLRITNDLLDEQESDL